MKKQLLISCLAVLAVLTGCADNATSPSDTTPVTVLHSETTVITRDPSLFVTNAVSAAQTDGTDVSAAGTETGTGTAAASGTVTATTAAAISDGEMPAFSIVLAPPMTMAPPQTEIVYTAAETQTTKSAPVQITLKAPISMANAIQIGKETALTGTGKVVAPDGLRMFPQPSATGEKLLTLNNGTEVQVLGGVFTAQPKTFDDTRFYHINANGKEGYVNAEYLAVKFNQRISELSQDQVCALTAFMYYQHQTLLDKFQFHGGLTSTGLDEKDSYISNQTRMMMKVKPNGITLESLNKSFFEYFYKPYYMANLQNYYEEKNGKLYACKSYRAFDLCNSYKFDNIAQITDTEVVFVLKAGEREGTGLDLDTFNMIWDNGCWKVSNDIAASYVDFSDQYTE